MILEELKAEYTARNPKSEKAYLDACDVIPGGVTANVKIMDPFPLFMKEGHGAWVTDLDGHKYVDYVLSYGPLIHGHGCEEIKETAEKYLEEHGTWLFGTPHEGEREFAELLQHYVPSLEMVRFTNSGTEATLLSLRLAQAFTGRRKIAKFEGHYHGGYNEVLISTGPKLSDAGDARHPNPVAESAGLFPDELENTVVLPFNDLDACRDILSDQCEEIAAVILEPLQAGTIPAEQDFIKGLRKLTEDLGIILIFDEVKTGFCISMHGAQGYYGIKPDLTTMGKIIGGGMPVGILGGRKDIMEMIAPGGSYLPDQGRKETQKVENLYHSGTYNGHPLILAMGVAAIRLLDQKYDNLLEQTNRLKNGISDIFTKHGIHILTPGVGAMFNVCITDQDVIRNYRDMKKCDMKLRRTIDFALILEGVYNKPCKRYNMSTAHDASVMDFTLEAYEKAFEMIR